MTVYLDWITGLCIGGEFFGQDALMENDLWAVNFDLGIFRITLVRHSSEA